jgi:hypothetical protein
MIIRVFSLGNPEKECFRTCSISSGRDLKLDVRIRRTEGSGSEGCSLRAEMLFQECFSMDSGGRGRSKENEREYLKR